MDLSQLSIYEDKSAFCQDVRGRCYEMEMKYHGCAQVIIQAYLDIFREHNPDLLKSASPFAAGMSLTGNNCGALIGGLMVLGTFFGRKDVKEGMEGILLGIKPMRKLVKYFMATYGTVNCIEITQTDLANNEKAKNYFDSGGLEKCANIIADVGVFVGDIIFEKYKGL